MQESPADIRSKRFTVTRKGFDQHEVNSYLASLSSDLTAVDPADIRRRQFGDSRRGYDKAEVMSYLNRIAYELEQDLASGNSPVADIDPVFADITAGQAIAGDEEIDPLSDDPGAQAAFEAAMKDEGNDDPALIAAVETSADSIVDTADDDEVETVTSHAPGIFIGAPPEPEPEPEFVPDLAFAPVTETTETEIEAETEIEIEVETEIEIEIESETELVVVPQEEPVESFYSDGQTTEVDAEVTDEATSAADLPVPDYEVTSAVSEEPIEAAITTDESVRPRVPVLPPLPDLPDVNPSRSTYSGHVLDDDGFQQAAAEMSGLLRDAHESAMRLRAQAEAEVTAAIEACDAELMERRRVQASQLEEQRAVAERQIAEARVEADTYISEQRARADEYAHETRLAADSYADRRQSQADTEAKALIAEAESYAKATSDNADDYDRRTRSESDAYSTRVRAEADTTARRTAEEAEKHAVALRAKAEREKQDADRETHAVIAEAERIRSEAQADAAEIIANARRSALDRSTQVLDRGRSLIASLAGLEDESRSRLAEAQKSINQALAATRVNAIPDADLTAQMMELREELDGLEDELDDYSSDVEQAEAGREGTEEAAGND